MDKQVLSTLAQSTIENSVDFAHVHGYDHNQLVSALNSLAAHDVISLTVLEKKETKLTELGEEVIANGSPEVQLWHTIPEEGKLKAEVDVCNSKRPKNS